MHETPAKIYQQMEGLVEFCTCFPILSIDPYWSKNLLGKYRKILADDRGTNSKDCIYCHKNDLFNVCKKICDISQLYYELFELLGSCKIAISPMSSKLMSVRTLLAVHELVIDGAEVGVVVVSAIRHNAIENFEHKTSVLHSVCLTEECHD